MKPGIFLALFLAAMPARGETGLGVAQLVDTSDANRPLALSIWYPSDEPASASVGGNPVFRGVQAAPGAPVAQAPLPLVVVSHGGLRSAADSGAWLSSSIARAGFIAVEVNAPRPAGGAVAVNEIWQRPRDLRRALDRVLADGSWGKRIDRDSISVAGFALGGTAALSLAGAGLKADVYTRSCDADREIQGPDCRWFAAQEVDLTQTSPEGLAGMARDPRVTAVIAVNPEYTAALGPVAADANVLRISLGQGPLERDRRGQTLVLPEAALFDAFALCTDAGPDILREDGGDASICGDGAAARRVVHKAIAQAVTTFLAGVRE